MSFDDGSLLPEGEELLLGDEAGPPEGGVEGGAGMSLGEDDTVVPEVFVVAGVELEPFGMEEEDSNELGNGGGGGGVA